MNISAHSAVRLRLGAKTFPVSQENLSTARSLDVDQDGFLHSSELAAHVLGDGVSPASLEGQDLLREFKADLSGQPNPVAKGYRSFVEMEQEMEALAQANPDLVQKRSLGKTSEGRDIWALKISRGAQGDTSHKTGMVVTGCHHAREWMTVEAPLKFMRDLLDNPQSPENKKRLEESEVWVIPVVNPDGYEYSRNVDSGWRKNRRPLGVDQNGKATRAIGVDLNRNYWDGKPEHLFVYRPAGDKPGNTWDDFSATSDNPGSEVYRGPHGASEVEVKSLLDLQLKNPNIKAVIDYHSYGDTILYPYGHTRDESPNASLYKELGRTMVEASSGFSLEQSVGLYPASGTSDDTHDLNGILNFTIEMGRSFQPNPRLIPEVSERVSRASLALLDELIVRDDLGTLPRPAVA